jgi:MoaA/NifB/PqqE/SkfB family radical SAM enzyme
VRASTDSSPTTRSSWHGAAVCVGTSLALSASMSVKLRPILGAARAVVQRRHPYFAHFFVTERCNLKCSYCDVWRAPARELALADQKRVIDRIAEVGASCLSFTGGEPLLCAGIFELIAHAAGRGLFTRITSNGLVARERYDALLASPVDAFSISIDGLGPSQLPYRKIDPRNRETIQYLAARRGRKRMGLSCTLHESNAAMVEQLVAWVASTLPGLTIFVQSVVIGRGHLRSAREPVLCTVEVLFALSRRYPGVVDNTSFFNRAAAAAATAGPGGYHWGCHAGQLFFDVKPDGRFWLCQDVPTELNVLDPDFIRAWRALDPRPLIAACAGCTYSCYLNTQKALELPNLAASASLVARRAGRHLGRLFTAAPRPAGAATGKLTTR